MSTMQPVEKVNFKAIKNGTDYINARFGQKHFLNRQPLKFQAVKVAEFGITEQKKSVVMMNSMTLGSWKTEEQDPESKMME